jgi:hypothetical protein
MQTMWSRFSNRLTVSFQSSGKRSGETWKAFR